MTFVFTIHNFFSFLGLQKSIQHSKEMHLIFRTRLLNIKNFISQFNFTLSYLTYDANGNILTMNQHGLRINTSPLIDQFNYTYIPNTNKLKNVRDQVNEATSTLGDFKTSALPPQNASKTIATTQAARDAITDYTYDANGSEPFSLSHLYPTFGASPIAKVL